MQGPVSPRGLWGVTWKVRLLLVLALKMRRMLSAARTGTVLFSTTILQPADTSAILRAQASMYFRSAALPFPIPKV